MKIRFHMRTAAALLLLFNGISALSNAQTVTDIDGNVYPVVMIGTQKWMGMNLRTTRFSDGSPITNAGYNNWYFFPLQEPRYAEPLILPNTIDTAALGFWYNYPAAGDTRNVCPKGWHVATDADWFNMIRYLDPNSDTVTTLESAVAGGMLKDTVLWIAPNTGASNSTGFSALPVSDISGSIIPPAGHVCCQGMNASFWCGGPPWTNGLICRYRYLWYWQPSVDRNTDDYSNGKSIRCVCDTLSSTSIKEIRMNDNIQVFPTPTTDKLTISSLDNSIGIGVMEVYNSFGTLVFTMTSATPYISVDVSDYSNGLYYIVFKSHNVWKKFIKG